MAKLNEKPASIFTYEGAKAKHITKEQSLRRAVMCSLLWENQFYEDGKDISERIAELIPLVSPQKVASIAIEARNNMKLRHMPLFIVREMARHNSHKSLVATTLEAVIQRADELSEFLAIYWKDGKQPLSAQVKKGLALAFLKFNEYQLAKYNRNTKIKLRDVLFLCHAKPINDEQSNLWKKLITNNLSTPDTWESELSAGKDKKQTWERLISEHKLGGLAFLRNLRNMQEVSVSEETIKQGLLNIKTDKILPFRFIVAAKHAPKFEAEIEKVMFRCLDGKYKLLGKTVLAVDGSGSMFGESISNKSEIDRFEAACALAILLKEICEQCVIIVFSDFSILVPSRRGFALRDVLHGKASRGGTRLSPAIRLAEQEKYDRIIVLTDEQISDCCPAPLPYTKAYMINVASTRNGIGYRNWNHIDGWSESIVDYIIESEKIK